LKPISVIAYIWAVSSSGADAAAPRRFSLRDEARAWIAATFEGWLQELTAPERDALAQYKEGDAYRQINGALRGTAAMSEQIETTIEDLDVAIARMRLPEPVVVWRAIALPALARAPDSLVGDTIEEAAYVSTSLLRAVALDYLEQNAGAGSGVLERITLAGGAHAAVVVSAAAPDLIVDLDEAELLLPRGTRLLVTEDNLDHDRRILDLEVIR